MTASFQTPEEGLNHQYADMPNVPQPEEIESDIKVFGNTKDMPDRVCESIGYHKPIDMRTVDFVDPAKEIVKEPKRYIWMKAQEVLSGDINLNQVMLAYASDYHFLSTALHPHGVSNKDKNLRMATIDHSMWFHHPFDFDEWLLYCAESPFSGGARGLVRGQFFNREGKLVASTMQEGLMRKIGVNK